VVSPQAARGILLALLVLAPALALPGPARADDPFCDQQEQAYDAAQSNGAGATPPYCRSPDLFGANLAATVTDERFPSQMCGYAANVAQDSATKSPFYVQLVLDGLPESSLQVLKLLHTGDFSDELCWNATLAAGWHRFSLTVDPPRGDAPNGDVAESDESNNVAPDRWFYVRPTPAPDLHLAAFRVSPPVGRPSTSQFMVATVANAGDAPSAPTTVAFYDDNGLVGSDGVPALQPGTQAEVFIYNDTDLRPAGNFTAMAVLDPANATVLQCTNTLYVACAPFEILPHPAPDLAVANVTVHGSFLEHRGLLVDALVTNLGDRAAGVAQIRVYDGAVPIANASSPNLGPGQTAHYQLYAVLGAGAHTLRVVADPDNLTVEQTRANNEWDQNLTIQGTAETAAQPDLLVERLDALPDDPSPGETVMVTALVRNAGQGASNRTTLLLRADGVLLASKDVPALPAGRSYSAVFSWGGAAEGNHTLSALVDPDRLVNESTRDDNAIQRDITIAAPASESPPPDVTPSPPTPPTTSTPPPGPDGGSPQQPPPEPPATLTVTNLDVITRVDGGSVKGFVGVVVRNPNLAPVDRVSVEFRLDGKLVGDKVIPGVPGAGTATQRTDDLDLPAGKHTVSADLKILGVDSAQPIHVEKTYDVAAPARFLPAPGVALLVPLVAALALAWRRRP